MLMMQDNKYNTEDIWKISASQLYNQALEEDVPLHKYFSWLLDEFEYKFENNEDDDNDDENEEDEE